MPSGAKKRKAAKKKLHNNQPHHHNHTNNPSYSQGSDRGDVERESAEEIAVKSYEGESNFAETAKEVNPAESHNGDASEEHKSSSSSSSSSDDDEVDVRKEKSVVGEVGDEIVKSDDFVPDVGLGESGVGAEVVEETVDECIPVEETVKEVVSTDLVNDSVPAESSSVPDVVDSELNRSLKEVSLPSGEKENVENSEGNEIPLVDNGSGNSSISADNTTRDVEDKSGGDDHVKESGKVNNSEEQPLISSTPLPVRQTSWMNCCGLFEVISGGSGR